MSETFTSTGYPVFERSERIADALVHLAGLLLAPIGGGLLLAHTAGLADAGKGAALTIYCSLLLFGLIASALYHFTPWEEVRPILRQIDHAAIYLKIAGTYTPVAVMVDTAFAYGVLACIWIAALAGAVRKLAFWRAPGPNGVLLYLALGWAAVLLIWPVSQTLPTPSVVLIILGGLLYSAGVIFFIWESLRYSMALWHGFVLAASACFYAAISLGTFGTIA